MKTNIAPVYWRELKSYFYSPVAYLVLFAFFILATYFWGSGVGWYSEYSMRMARRGGDMKLMEYLFGSFFSQVVITFIFLLPLVSMRGFAEEKKQGTIETLFTLPLSDFDILMGKYLAQLTLLLSMVLPLLLFTFGISDKVSIHWPMLGADLLGLYLVGAMFLAVGLFTSSLTENQVIAAALGFGAALLFFLLSWLENLVPPAFRGLVTQLGVMEHYHQMNLGVVALKDVSYFVLFSFAALFGTLRVLESKKWR